MSRRVDGQDRRRRGQVHRAGPREVEWVERATGEHPDDDIVGDESTVFRAREAYLVRSEVRTRPGTVGPDDAATTNMTPGRSKPPPAPASSLRSNGRRVTHTETPLDH